MRRVGGKRRGGGLMQARFIQSQAQAKRTVLPCHRRFQRPAGLAGSKRQTEAVRRSRHARQMAIQPDKIAIEFQSLDQVQGRRGASKKRALSRHSAYSDASSRILHHAAADAQRAAFISKSSVYGSRH